MDTDNRAHFADQQPRVRQLFTEHHCALVDQNSISEVLESDQRVLTTFGQIPQQVAPAQPMLWLWCALSPLTPLHRS